MSIATWIKDWLGIDELQEEIERELNAFKKEVRERVTEIVKNEISYHNEKNLGLVDLKDKLGKQIEKVESKVNDNLQLLENKISQLKVLEDRVSDLETRVNSQSNVFKIKFNNFDKFISDYKEHQVNVQKFAEEFNLKLVDLSALGKANTEYNKANADQIDKLSEDLKTKFTEITKIKDELRNGMKEFAVGMRELIAGNIKSNLMSFLKLPEGSTVATDKDLKKIVDHDISKIHERINEEHDRVVKVWDFLSKVYKGNVIIFNEFFNDRSEELVNEDDHSFDNGMSNFSS